MGAIEVARDWLDYVEGFGAGGSLALAVVAAIFAWRSARDSSRSAKRLNLAGAAASNGARWGKKWGKNPHRSQPISISRKPLETVPHLAQRVPDSGS